MTELSAFMPPQCIVPTNSWIAHLSLKEYKIIWKKNKRSNTKIILRDFDFTMGKIDSGGGNNTQRFYRYHSNYVLSKLTLDHYDTIYWYKNC